MVDTYLISAIVGTYEVSIDLTFSNDMLNDDELNNVSNYSLNNDMYVRKVDILSTIKIRLWVELFYGHTNFILTISSNIKDIFGNSIINRICVVYPSSCSIAKFSNYNGLVETYHDSYYIFSDSQRVYLGGTKGIDIFRKYNLSTYYQWGRIFDQYGIDAMFVINSPNDLVISDKVPPYVSYEDPSPIGALAVPATTDIWFIITDAVTAVEIKSLYVFINGILTFNGNCGGWQNGFSGEINMMGNSLGAKIHPPSPFLNGSINSVRIVAQDVVFNLMDYSYNFVVTLLGGFGLNEWALIPFGVS